MIGEFGHSFWGPEPRLHRREGCGSLQVGFVLPMRCCGHRTDPRGAATIERSAGATEWSPRLYLAVGTVMCLVTLLIRPLSETP